MRAGAAWTSGLRLKGLDQSRNVDRLDQIVVPLTPNRFQGGSEIGVSSQDVRPGLRLSPAQGDDHYESVAWLSNVQIRKQDVKRLPADFRDRLGHRRHGNAIKSFCR